MQETAPNDNCDSPCFCVLQTFSSSKLLSGLIGPCAGLIIHSLVYVPLQYNPYALCL